MNKQLYTPQFLKELRQGCKEQASYSCELCGAQEGEIRVSQRTGKQYILYLHAAHVNGAGPQDPDAQLMCLCPKCHMRLDRQQELTERTSSRRRGYQLTTTDSLIQALRVAGLQVVECVDGYEWSVDHLTGKATSAIHAVADAVYHLRQSKRRGRRRRA